MKKHTKKAMALAVLASLSFSQAYALDVSGSTTDASESISKASVKGAKAVDKKVDEKAQDYIYDPATKTYKWVKSKSKKAYNYSKEKAISTGGEVSLMTSDVVSSAKDGVDAANTKIKEDEVGAKTKAVGSKSLELSGSSSEISKAGSSAFGTKVADVVNEQEPVAKTGAVSAASTDTGLSSSQGTSETGSALKQAAKDEVKAKNAKTLGQKSVAGLSGSTYGLSGALTAGDKEFQAKSNEATKALESSLSDSSSSSDNLTSAPFEATGDASSAVKDEVKGQVKANNDTGSVSSDASQSVVDVVSAVSSVAPSATVTALSDDAADWKAVKAGKKSYQWVKEQIQDKLLDPSTNVSEWSSEKLQELFSGKEAELEEKEAVVQEAIEEAYLSGKELSAEDKEVATELQVQAVLKSASEGADVSEDIKLDAVEFSVQN